MPYRIPLNDTSLDADFLTVSQEADFLGIGKATADFAKTLSTFVGDVKTRLGTVFAGLTRRQASKFHPDSALDRNLMKANYVQLSAMELSVPTGFKGPWTDYLAAVGEGIALAESFRKDVLIPTKFYFSQLLGAPELLSTLAPQQAETEIKDRTAERDAIMQRIATTFNQNSNSEKLPFGHGFPRLSDWGQCAGLVETLNYRLGVCAPEAMQKDVDELIRIMELLAIRMKQDTARYAVTGPRAKALSQHALNLGNEAQFYSSLYYQLQTITESFQNATEALKKVV